MAPRRNSGRTPKTNDNGVPNQPNDNGVANQPPQFNDNGVPNQSGVNDNGQPDQPQFNDDGQPGQPDFNDDDLEFLDDIEVIHDPRYGDVRYHHGRTGVEARPRQKQKKPSEVVNLKVNKHRLKHVYITTRQTRSRAKLPGAAPLTQLSYLGKTREVRQRTRY